MDIIDAKEGLKSFSKGLRDIVLIVGLVMAALYASDQYGWPAADLDDAISGQVAATSPLPVLNEARR